MKNKILWIIAVILFILLGLMIVLISSIPKPELTDEQRQEQAEIEKSKDRKKTIEANLSSWDGSHKELSKYIKDNLNDPSSFEHLETVYFDQDSVVIFITQYTAKNAFGGRVKGYAKAKADSTGKLTEILEIE